FLVFLLALLGLLSLLGFGLALGITLGLAFTLGLLLTLLNDFRFSRSHRRVRHHFWSPNHFFFHRGDVRDHLVFVGQELQLFAVWQILHAHFNAEHEMADVHFEVLRDVGRKALHLDLTQQLFEDAALRLHTFSLALEHDRNGDRQPLVHGDALQVYVE